MTDDNALGHFEQLKGFLEADPENTALLADCAGAAVAAGKLEEAVALYKQLDAVEPLALGLANDAGVTAMRAGDQMNAQLWLARVLDDHPDDPGILFNLAWSKALGKDFEGAVEFLKPEVIDALPQAAMLDLQIDHELARFEEVGEKIKPYLEKHPDYAPLQAAVSVLAMDLDDPELARHAAAAGCDHPDALATLATLELGEQNHDAARAHYEKALATRADNPRAEIGLGLVELAQGNPAEATQWLDKGAERFGDHLGTWVAAGWAYFIAGDLDTARKRFETTVELDQTFGEGHGSLAFIELLQGDTQGAEKRIEIAKRLDRESFSTALASMLMEQSKGDTEKAELIFRIASQQPILPNGSTLMDEIVKALT